MTHIVVIGGGHAAAQITSSLRMKKFHENADNQLTIISEEPHLPYQRPPLSKAYLKGELTEERLPILRQTAYDSLGANLILGERVDQIDPATKTVKTKSQTITYDKLIIATGGRARPLNCPGADLPDIYYIRRKDDIEKMSDSFQKARSVAVIGGGYIGLEAASVAREAGKSVTIFEAENRILARVVAPVVSEYYMDLHNRHGVQVKTGALVTKIEKTEEGLRVYPNKGAPLDVDLIIAGIGMLPNIEIAEQAGIDTDKLGICVNEHCQTSVEHIYAVGDVCSLHHPKYGGPMRLESVPNAADMAKVTVSHILGEDALYDSLPWFWSDQYGIKLQIAGLGSDADQVIIRGDINSDSVAFFYFKKDHLIAADCANRMQEFMAAKKLIDAGIAIDPKKLADDTRSIKEITKEIFQN